MDNSHETTSFNYIADFGNLEFSATMYENDFARNWFKVDKIDNKKVYGHGNGINNIIAAANAGEATASAILNGTNADTNINITTDITQMKGISLMYLQILVFMP